MNYRGRSVLGDEVEKPADTPIELSVTPLGEVAALLLSAQKANTRAGAWRYSEDVAKLLMDAGLFVDMERGDGQ